MKKMVSWNMLLYRCTKRYESYECVPGGIAALNHTYLQNIICAKVSEALVLRFYFVPR